MNTNSIKLNDTEYNKKEELLWIDNWLKTENGYDVEPDQVDLVLEFLHDRKLLNENGKRFAHDYWEKHIKEDDEE